MHVEGVLFPGQPTDLASSVSIVVDVLRASSSIVTILDRGAAEILTAATVEEARELSELFPDFLLCGERGSLPLEGFDYGNSPTEFAGADLNGRSVILATSNGTRTLEAVARTAPAVFVGALVNREAVARAAVSLAGEQGLDTAIVCAGERGGTTFALEDALGAGAIADAIVRARPDARLTDAARLALYAYASVADHLTSAVQSTYHAQALVDAGFGDDVAYCSRLDVSEAVPLAERDESGRLRIGLRANADLG